MEQRTKKEEDRIKRDVYKRVSFKLDTIIKDYGSANALWAIRKYVNTYASKKAIIKKIAQLEAEKTELEKKLP